MKKGIFTILTLFFTTICMWASPINLDKVIGEHTTKDELTYTVYQERDGDIYITITSEAEKDKLKVDAENKEHAKYIINELDTSLKSYSTTPIKNFIKDFKKYGEYDRDDDTRIKYFEIDDDLFNDYFTKDGLTYDFFSELD